MHGACYNKKWGFEEQKEWHNSAVNSRLWDIIVFHNSFINTYNLPEEWV